MTRVFNFRPQVPRDVYVCRAIETAFLGGEWVEELASPDEGFAGSPSRPDGLNAGDVGGVGDASADGGPAPPVVLTIIGGTKYDEQLLLDTIAARQPTRLITGDGRGVEKFVAGLDVTDVVVQIKPDKERLGKFAANCHVTQILNYEPDSPLLIVGDGTRPKQAREWLKRIGYVNGSWGTWKPKREVIEIP